MIKRKERGTAAANRAIKNFLNECKDLGTYQMTDEEMDAYLNMSFEEKRAYKFKRKEDNEN